MIYKNKNKVIAFKKPITNTMPKPMIVYFKLIHICLGLDFGFMKFQSTRWIISKLSTLLYAIFFSSICVFVFLFYLSPLQIAWYSSYVFTYLTQVLMLVLSNENTFWALLNDLIAIDTQMGITTKIHRIDVKLILYTTFCVLYRVVFSIVYCSLLPENCINLLLGTIFFIVPLWSIDVVLIVYFFVFYSIYCRVRTLVDSIENNMLSISSSQSIYRCLLISAEKVLVTFNRVFLVALLFTTPNVLTSIYSSIKELQQGPRNQSSVNVFGSWLAVSSTIHILVLFFAPAIAAGFVTSRVETLKSLLYDRLVDEKDNTQYQAMTELVRYIEARPFKFTICKILKVDWTFPVVILNVIVTYLIVILQFNPSI
ncbi:uncharacterized protein LOC132902927 isoform X2 [Amyelois transitella]|uniref:uncharacterized protein LOC132902927 isoform X2 n=1 Tax=Amyelois transitella TaxID=680683 RepID=UPI00298FCFAE|nr:uncharacterized protein LOC132902927 isoform X2 [Amyelois transitella]